MHSLFFFCLTIFLVYQPVTPLCSSTAYSAQIREILSSQTEYDVYEGDLVFIPKWSDPVGTNPSGIYGMASFNNYQINDPNSIAPNLTYFLRSSNAIIFPLCTPPESAYFSMASYVMDRFNIIKNGIYEKRQIIFATFGSSLNHLLWDTSSINNDIFNSLSTFIQTPDQNTFNYFYNLLTQNNINSEDINLQSIPLLYSNFVPYEYNAHNINQYNTTYDTAYLLYRIAIPGNETANNIYTNITQKIYMLQPKNASGNQPKKGFKVYQLNEYSVDNINETSIYHQPLNQYKYDLITYIESTYNYTIVNESIIGPWPPGSQPISCGVVSAIEANVNVGGNNCDDLYNQINVGTNMNENVFYIVLGIIHSNTDIKQTVYDNIVYYDDIDRLFETPPVINSFEYNGSGLILPVKTNVDNKYLKNIFVVQIAKKDNCIDQLPGLCIEGRPTAGVVTLRNYLNPITKTAPISTEIVPSIWLQFKVK